jgi:hypothetical protein
MSRLCPGCGLVADREACGSQDLVEEPQFGLGCGHRGQARLAECAADAIVDESIVEKRKRTNAGY